MILPMTRCNMFPLRLTVKRLSRASKPQSTLPTVDVQELLLLVSKKLPLVNQKIWLIWWSLFNLLIFNYCSDTETSEKIIRAIVATWEFYLNQAWISSENFENWYFCVFFKRLYHQETMGSNIWQESGAHRLRSCRSWFSQCRWGGQKIGKLFKQKTDVTVVSNISFFSTLTGNITLQGTNISHQKSLLKMIFLFPR